MAPGAVTTRGACVGHALILRWRLAQDGYSVGRRAGAGQLTTIELAPLNSEEAAALGAQVRKQTLDGQAARKLFEETGGNPLFVIESVSN